jgi:hypothetical protein
MHVGKLLFAQLMEHLPEKTFERCVARYGGHHAKEKDVADQARADKHSLILTTLLRTAERAGEVKLVVDKDGRITGGEVISIQVPTARLELAALAPTISVEPTPPTSP